MLASTTYVPSGNCILIPTMVIAIPPAACASVSPNIMCPLNHEYLNTRHDE